MANCTKCGKKLRSDNRSGHCAAGSSAKACRERTAALNGASPSPAATEAPPTDGSPDAQQQFFQLAGLLGLNPDALISDFCREWVEKTRARALGDE